MAQTGVADNTDPGSIYFNPANVVSTPRAYITGSHWEWAPTSWTVSTGSIGGSWTGRRGTTPLTFGADLTFATDNFDEILRTIYLPQGTGEPTPDEWVGSLALGAGALLGERWDVRLGGAIKRYWESGGESRDGFGFDVGTTVAYRATASEWSITPAAAMAFVNLGPTLYQEGDYDVKLPARFDYGFSVHIESPHVEINSSLVPLLAITCNLDGVDRFYGARSSWGLGSELALAQILFLRTGVMHEETLHDWEEPGFVFSSLGVGLALPIQSVLIRFDYAKLPILFDQNRYGVYAAVAF
jgi:hypothetical protein